MNARPVHPFPGRMAPEVVLAKCSELDSGAVVLDPMSGSGTVLRAASDQGLAAVGFDLDPLSVLMSRVWTTPIDSEELRLSAVNLVRQAEGLTPSEISLPWIDSDPATEKYVDYWFGPRQQVDLRCLAFLLHGQTSAMADALRIALSRIIITKDRGASLGRDVSHSRPHRVVRDSDFAVMREFIRSAERLSQRLSAQPPTGNVRVQLGDARRLTAVMEQSVDAVITSPPYLNALDYIRGHRLSLVWLGFSVNELRSVRSESIGAERALESDQDQSIVIELLPALGDLRSLPARIQRMIDRYVWDLSQVLREVRRVLKVGGSATFVVGNSCLRGVYVDNAAAVTAAARRVGLRQVGRSERDLPQSRRYLPPPTSGSSSGLTKRMRTESVLSFEG